MPIYIYIYIYIYYTGIFFFTKLILKSSANDYTTMLCYCIMGAIIIIPI